jgi:hypothetical protein
MTYAAIRVLSAFGLAHGVKLPELKHASMLPIGASRPKRVSSGTRHEQVGARR